MGLIWSRTKPPPPPPSPLVQLAKKLLAAQAPSPAAGGAPVNQPLWMKLFGSYLPIVLSFGQSFYMLYSGSAESASLYFSPTSYVGVGNSFTWLLYNTIILKVNPSAEEILANGLVLLANGQNLMSFCTWKGLKQRGYTIGISLCVGLFLVLCLLIWTPTLPSLVRYPIGSLGIITAFGSHCFMLRDIVKSPSDKWTRLFTAVNIVPNMVLNFAYFVVTKGWLDQDILTQIVSGLGIFFNFLELIILLTFKSRDMDVNVPDEDDKDDDSPDVEAHKLQSKVHEPLKLFFADGEKQGVLIGNQHDWSLAPTTSTSRTRNSMGKRQRSEDRSEEEKVVPTVNTAGSLCCPGGWCCLFGTKGDRAPARA